jgi:hypothetical protein
VSRGRRLMVSADDECFNKPTVCKFKIEYIIIPFDVPHSRNLLQHAIHAVSIDGGDNATAVLS